MADRFVGCHSRLFLLLLLLTNLCVAVQEQQQQSTFEGNTILKGDGGQAYDWDLVIVIPSHITEFSRRCAVRDGWARQLRGHEQNNRAGLRSIKLLFTVGAHYPDNSTRDTAMAEMKQFGDIIQLPEWFEDRYDALGTKVRLSFQRAVDLFGRFRLLLKADTDSYVHVDRLLDFLDQHDMWNKERVYAGSFRHAPVMWEPQNKDHKWFDGEFTKMTGLTQYPWNAQGGGYVISYDLAKYLAHPPLQLKSWTHEDVGVGAWLMALDHERIDMPVNFAEPECGCGAECWSGSSITEPVIDHYVPEYLQRWRERRYELFGDSCWTPEKNDAVLPSDVLLGDRRAYPPTVMGVLNHRYHFSPLMAFGEEALLDDHSDTRSGVCAIDFAWGPPTADDNVTASHFLSRGSVPFMGRDESDMMVCRGSDGCLYDQLECAPHRTVSDDDEEWIRVDVNSSSTTRHVPWLVRTGLTLSQCKELGRYPQTGRRSVGVTAAAVIGWTPDGDEGARGVCRVYSGETTTTQEGLAASRDEGTEIFFRRDERHQRLPVESSIAAVQIRRNAGSSKCTYSCLKTVTLLLVGVGLAGITAAMLTVIVPMLGRLSPFYPVYDAVHKAGIFRILPRIPSRYFVPSSWDLYTSRRSYFNL